MHSVAALPREPTIPRIQTARRARDHATIITRGTETERGGRAALASSEMAQRSTKKRSGIFAGVSIREPAKDWCAAPVSGIVPAGTSRFQRQKVLEFYGLPAQRSSVLP